MKLAAIDIGSNAVRLQVTRVLEYQKVITFKELEYVRFPLRLGRDVFTNGRISESNIIRFNKLMHAYKHLIDLYEVDAFYGCATSAMRESKNGQLIVDKLRNDLGLNIEIISGDQEAEMINKVILQGLDNDRYIHIDVGGGSTELNVYENHKKIYSHSFKIGSVRILEGRDASDTWQEMKDWITKHSPMKREGIIAIGTGGNINKLLELSNFKSRKMSLKKLLKIQHTLKNMTLKDRLNKLQLNPDRADVIIPASHIYISAMQASNANHIIIPNIGLKDGINYYLYQTHYPHKNKVFVKSLNLLHHIPKNTK